MYPLDWTVYLPGRNRIDWTGTIWDYDSQRRVQRINAIKAAFAEYPIRTPAPERNFRYWLERYTRFVKQRPNASGFGETRETKDLLYAYCKNREFAVLQLTLNWRWLPENSVLFVNFDKQTIGVGPLNSLRDVPRARSNSLEALADLSHLIPVCELEFEKELLARYNRLLASRSADAHEQYLLGRVYEGLRSIAHRLNREMLLDLGEWIFQFDFAKKQISGYRKEAVKNYKAILAVHSWDELETHLKGEE